MSSAEKRSHLETQIDLLRTMTAGRKPAAMTTIIAQEARRAEMHLYTMTYINVLVLCHVPRQTIFVSKGHITAYDSDRYRSRLENLIAQIKQYSTMQLSDLLPFALTLALSANAQICADKSEAAWTVSTAIDRGIYSLCKQDFTVPSDYASAGVKYGVGYQGTMNVTGESQQFLDSARIMLMGMGRHPRPSRIRLHGGLCQEPGANLHERR